VTADVPTDPLDQSSSFARVRESLARVAEGPELPLRPDWQLFLDVAVKELTMVADQPGSDAFIAQAALWHLARLWFTPQQIDAGGAP
jgi:hypothetical protein